MVYFHVSSRVAVVECLAVAHHIRVALFQVIDEGLHFQHAYFVVAAASLHNLGILNHFGLQSTIVAILGVFSLRLDQELLDLTGAIQTGAP